MRLKNPNRWVINETKRFTSLLRTLRNEKRSDEYFELMLNNLTLEEVIALKLELSVKTLKSPMYGLPLWKMIGTIAKDAVIRFAVSCTKTPAEAARLLGFTTSKLFSIIEKYNIWNYLVPNGARISNEKRIEIAKNGMKVRRGSKDPDKQE